MRYAFLFLLACLWACDSGRQAGTSTETTNGVIAGTLEHNKLPLVGANVSMYLPTGELWQQNVALTDSLGGFFIANQKGRFHLAANNSELSTWRFNVQSDVDTNLLIEMYAPNQVQIHGLAPGDSVELMGTPYRSVSEVDHVAWTGVPQGNYTILINKNPAANLRLNQGIDTILTLASMAQTANEILLDNFDAGSGYHLWVPYSGRGDWFLSAQGEAEIVQPANGDFVRALVENDGGKAVQIKYANNDGNSENIVQIGVHLSEQVLDFRALEGIRFKVKGDCQLRVALENGHATKYQKAIWAVEISENWQEVFVNVDQEIFAEHYEEHVEFSQVADKINLLTFFAFGGSELSIDDVYLMGLNPEDMLPKEN